MTQRVWGGIAAGVVGVVALLLFQRCRDRQLDERIGQLTERAERLARDSATAANTVRRTDSVFSVDTVRFTRTVARFRVRVDSLRVTDTLTVREQVIVAAADTAIQACRVALSSCDLRVAARDTLIRILGNQRQTDRSLFRAQLARANPRILPYVEGMIDPGAARAVIVRGGLEMRLVGPVRLVGALQYQNLANHTLTPFVGVRVLLR